jgi:phage terminase large subunit-like protein
MIDAYRRTLHPSLYRIVVGVDPPASAKGAECGIVVAGIAKVDGTDHGFILSDNSRKGTPGEWGGAVVTAYHLHNADRVIGEVNNGGDMIEHTIRTVENGKNVSYKSVRATRGKALRAEPVVGLYEQGRVHHVGSFLDLEDQMCEWEPGQDSPDRIDALVWALTELMVSGYDVTVGRLK